MYGLSNIMHTSTYDGILERRVWSGSLKKHDFKLTLLFYVLEAVLHVGFKEVFRFWSASRGRQKYSPHFAVAQLPLARLFFRFSLIVLLILCVYFEVQQY